MHVFKQSIIFFSIPTSAQLSQFVVLNLTGKIFGEGSARILNKLCEEGEFANPVEVAQQDNLLLDSNVESIQVLCDSFVKENLAMVNLDPLEYFFKSLIRRKNIIHCCLSVPNPANCS